MRQIKKKHGETREDRCSKYQVRNIDHLTT
jgi:hypothetical protein